MSNGTVQPFSDIPADQDFVRMGFFEENQLGVLMQEKVIDDLVMLAFNAGPESYYYFEGGSEVPVALWSFRFARLPGLYEVNFDIQRTHPVDIDALINDRVSHNIRFYLRMAGQLVDAATLEIDPQAWSLFLETLRKQQAVGYLKEDYDMALEMLYNYTSDEIAAMGQKFDVPHKQKASHLRVIPGGKSCH